jgi:predicted DNA-binding ribbon-helix-helix protein
MPKRPKGSLGGSLVLKRTVVLNGHKTSVSAETAFWDALREIAAAQGTTIGQLIATIDHERRERQHINLSSAIRLFVLDYYRSRMPPERSGPR